MSSPKLCPPPDTPRRHPPPAADRPSPLLSPHPSAALSLPSFSLPNVTSIMDEAKASLKDAARAAVLEAVAMRPIKCPNGNPLVTCLWNVCDNQCNGTTNFCVPDYCGSCGHK